MRLLGQCDAPYTTDAAQDLDNQHCSMACSQSTLHLPNADRGSASNAQLCCREHAMYAMLRTQNNELQEKQATLTWPSKLPNFISRQNQTQADSAWTSLDTVTFECALISTICTAQACLVSLSIHWKRGCADLNNIIIHMHALSHLDALCSQR